MSGRLISWAKEVLSLVEFIKRIQDALGTDETGEALIEVARNAHKAELELAALLELADELDMIFDRIALTAKEIHILVQQIALRQAAKELHKHTPDEKAPWRCAECAPGKLCPDCGLDRRSAK